MMHRMKQNAMGLASIAILCTMTLVTIGGTVSLFVGLDSIVPIHLPDSAQVQVEDREEGEWVLDYAKTAADNAQLPLDSARLKSFDFLSPHQMPEIYGDQPVYHSSLGTTVVSQGYYNDKYGAELALLLQEAAFFGLPPEVAGNVETTEWRGAPYTVVLRQEENPEAVGSVDVNGHSVLMVVPQLPEKDLYHRVELNYASDSPGVEDFEQQLSAMTQQEDFSLMTQNRLRQELYMTYGGFLFLGVLMGLLFTIATALIIYYKQVSEGMQDKHRFEILSKVGMSQKEIKGTINKQILLLFFLPLLVAVIHLSVALKPLMQMLSLFHLYDKSLILICYTVTVALFSVIYTAIYKLTAREYLKILQVS